MAKVRIYCPFFPYPFREASWQIMFNQAMAIHLLGHEVEIVSWKTTAVEVQKILKESFNKWPRQIQFTVFTNMGPVRGTLPQWLALTNLPQQTSRSSRFSRVRRSLTSNLAPVEIQYYDPNWDQRRFLEEADYEIYHYSFAYAWLKNGGRYSRRRVVHFHNLESDLFELRASQSHNIFEKSLHKKSAWKLKSHELALANLCDEIWQHSEPDLIEYRHRIGHNIQARVVSPCLAEDLLESRKGFVAGTDLKLGFIGGLDFEPNFLSFKWILNSLSPKLAVLGFQGRISQVGKNPERVNSWASAYPFVELNGFVENVEDWWKTLSFLLVPDLTGAGVRLKILEAIASGIPVIVNKRAAERVSREVRSSPLLIVLEGEEEWAKYIMSQKPNELREKLAELPMNEGLLGRTVYSFLNGI